MDHSGYHSDHDAFVRIDRPWTFNPANSEDISTPIGANEHFRNMDALLASDEESTSNGPSSVLDKLILALFLLFFAAVALS